MATRFSDWALKLFGSGQSQSGVADGATAIAYDWDTANALPTAGAKHSSYKVNGVEKIAIDNDGVITAAVGADVKVATGTANSASGFKIYDSSGTLKFTMRADGEILPTRNYFGGSGYSVQSGGFIVAGTIAPASQNSGYFNQRELMLGAFYDGTISIHPISTDATTKTLSIKGHSAWASAVTNTTGGDLEIDGGEPAGAGARGQIIMATLPTADPTVAGALWSNAGVLTLSAG